MDGFSTTLPETNSKFAPKNGWLEDDPASFWGPAYFQVRLLLVSGRVPTNFTKQTNHSLVGGFNPSEKY